MRGLALAGACVGAIVVVFACGSDDSVSASGSDASADVPDGTTPASDGGFCCPPHPAPQCCMAYGGWSPTGECFSACDGMPVPSTPGWKLVDDPYGCKVWSQPSGGVKCGQAMIPDAGSD